MDSSSPPSSPQQGPPERIMMGLMLGGIAYGCLLTLYPFFSALLWAGILCYVTWPLFSAIRSRTNSFIAALAMLTLSALLGVLPIGLMASTLHTFPETMQGTFQHIGNHITLPALPKAITTLPFIGEKLYQKWVSWQHNLASISDFVLPYLGTVTRLFLSLLLQAAQGILQLVMALFIAFFFWLNGDILGATIKAVIYRITGPYAERLLRMTSDTIRGTVYGVLGTAILQGILTGAGFAFLDIPNSVFFGSVAAFISVLPIGAPVVWIPAALWLIFMHGRVAAGIFLLLYGVIIISGADHFLRPMFISRGTRLPYLLTLLGILGGVIAFGGIGIFLGPVLLGVGFTLVAEFAYGHVSLYQSNK
ncbi:AI-2E family transporter [Entomobacter blattae]|nr:AI-2E family transporter [Entomobacter blattae]